LRAECHGRRRTEHLERPVDHSPHHAVDRLGAGHLLGDNHAAGHLGAGHHTGEHHAVSDDRHTVDNPDGDRHTVDNPDGDRRTSHAVPHNDQDAGHAHGGRRERRPGARAPVPPQAARVV